MKQLTLNFKTLEHLPFHAGIVSINWAKNGKKAKDYTVILKRLTRQAGNSEWFATTLEKNFKQRYNAFAYKNSMLETPIKKALGKV